MTDANLAGALSMSAAAREQGDVTALDLELAEAARARHPAARWWWGERTIDGANGAYCYLCDRMVATWARAWPTTREAIDAILLHRRTHGASRLFSFGHRAAARSAAAKASTVEGQE